MKIEDARIGMKVRLNKNAPHDFFVIGERSGWIGQITGVGVRNGKRTSNY